MAQIQLEPISINTPTFPPGSKLPNLSSGFDQQIILSWVQPKGDAYELVYSSFNQDQWSQPKIIAKGDNWFINWADFPSVIALDDHHWAAHWLVKRPGGKYAYDVALSLSDDAGKSWKKAFIPHRDNTPTEHGFVSLYPTPSGVGALWLDGRNTLVDSKAEHQATSLRYARFDHLGHRQQFGEIDPITCDCCQTDVAIVGQMPVIAYRGRTVANIRDITVRRRLHDRWSEPVTNGKSAAAQLMDRQ